MHPIKKLLFAELRKRVSDINDADTDETLNLKIFHQSDSLRLSFHGFTIVKTIFTAYSFEIPNDIKSKHRKSFSKLQYPYFFTQKRLIIFSESDAIIIKLKGNIKSFLEHRLD